MGRSGRRANPTQSKILKEMKKSRTQENIDHSLTVIAPAKINLHLEILGLRTDGFHELAMVMQSIDLCDQIKLVARNDNIISLKSDNSNLSNDDDNLIVKAAKLLRSESGNLNLGVDMFLKKCIPIGAGLAGGSTDAAATFLGLNSLWNLKFSLSELERFAAKIGSDIPFCLKGGTQLCFGRGELLEPLNYEYEPLAVVLVKDPNVSVSTPWAYQRFREKNSFSYLNSEVEFNLRRECLRKEPRLRPLSSKNPPSLRNDLQSVVFEDNQSVRKSLKLLNEFKGALKVAMSGSGPSCFALYSDLQAAKQDVLANKQRLAQTNLDVWCCSFLNHGVQLNS